MPNWCHNTLYITGPASDAAALRSLVITPRSKFDFEAVVPAPEVVDDWQSWSAEKWGTSKVAFDAGWMGAQRAAKRDAQQVAFFSTAWGPPIPVISELSRLFAALILRLQYDEPMWGFCGFATQQNGETIAAKHEEYALEDQSIGTWHGLQHLNDHDSIYIGLGRDADADCPGLAPSRWANPFATDGRSHRDAAELYRRWVHGDPTAAALLPSSNWSPPDPMDFRELVGKTLVCDCGKQRFDDECHAETLSAMAFNQHEEPEDCTEDECDALPR
jgi:hypothetical protein